MTYRKSRTVKVFSLTTAASNCLNFLVFVIITLHFKTTNVEAILQITPPESLINVKLGGSIVLTCRLANVDQVGVIVNIQWFSPKGFEILDKTPGIDNTPYIDKSVMLTNKLYIMMIQTQHAGNYTCRAVVGGNEEKQTVVLAIYQDITFDIDISPQHPIAYTNGLIKCRVTGQPIPNVFWRYRGQRIVSTGRYVQDVYGLYIQNITAADNGLYDCCAEVESKGVFQYQTIDVIVYLPARVKSFVNSQGVASQEYAFQCLAEGLPHPKVEFYRGTNTNPLYTTDRVQWDGDGGILNFRPLISDDESYYNCRAYNDAGEDQAMAYLKVLVMPTVRSVINVTQNEGKSATLVCNSFGIPAPEMTYRKEFALQDFVMGSNEGGRIRLTSPEPGILWMTIDNLGPDDMANYTCRSRNIAGYHHLNGSIIVNFVPRFPVGQPLIVYNWAGKTRNITCTVRAEPVPRFDWLHLNFQLVDNETFRIYQMFKSSNLQVRIREFDQSSIYGEYVCRARNQLGGANMSIQLVRAILPGIPSNVIVTETTPTTIRLQISPPTDMGGAELIGYNVQHDIFNQEFLLDDPYLIEYLRPSNKYQMYVRARTEVGLGTPRLLTVQTADVRAPYPIIITSNPVGLWPFQYIVTWQKPETGGIYIREYEFRLRAVQVVPGTHEVQNPLEDWSRRIKMDDYSAPLQYFVLEALNPSTHYQLEIRVLNDIGWSLPNSEFVFSTTPDVSYGIYQLNGAAATHSFPVLILAILSCMSRFDYYLLQLIR